jgi:hypothetical protein
MLLRDHLPAIAKSRKSLVSSYYPLILLQNLMKLSFGYDPEGKYFLFWTYLRIE